MRRYDVLVIGEINVDLILRADEITPVFGQEKLVDDCELTMGSSSVIAACGMARLGLRTGFFGRVGDDEFGRFMLREMAARGIDVSPVIVDGGVKTGITVSLSTPRDRAMLTHLGGSIDGLEANDVPLDLLEQTRHVHVGSFFLQARLQPGLADLFAQAHARGATTSLDVGWDVHERWDGGLWDALAHTDVFLPNEVEATHITGLEDVEAALERLAGRVGTVAVKLGAQGAIARRGDEVARAPVLPVSVVDTTGAGDSFNAGFIYGFLHGWPLDLVLRLGTACGSLSTTKAGGTAGQPTLEEALSALRAVGVDLSAVRIKG
ncbi:MAG TPA: carbohydrate kinase family protein [Caldilineae bacterium]|jgi:sugar/nucleoside kinase (ribokinase family)|nr:carbohydrate kinase family protein [Caldilineae bacterium]